MNNQKTGGEIPQEYRQHETSGEDRESKPIQPEAETGTEFSPENIESQIEKLMAQEERLFLEYRNLYGDPEPDSEVDREEYRVRGQAISCEPSVQVREDLEQFIGWIKEQIAKKKKSE